VSGRGQILVGGEALYDLVLADDDLLRGYPGGGPFNTARSIGRLEQPVAYLGRLSTDRFGRKLEGILAADGVDLGAVVRTEEPTTLALAETDSTGNARYRFYDEGTAAPGLTAADALAVLPDSVAILHVGTLGLTLEPIATALEAVVEAVAPDALVAVDPNCRPWAITDLKRYRARLSRVLSRSHLVKVSEEDLAWLDPGRPPATAARALLDLGPTVALLTRGPEGALVVWADGEVEVPARPTQVADTIGAGDAFGAGFLSWWHSQGLGRDALSDREAVAEATAFAVLVAARTVERPGASPPRLSELSAGYATR
jgi:fructokinase